MLSHDMTVPTYSVTISTQSTKRTSQSQFETMVNFMEMNGDLSKPTGSAAGRLNTYRKWTQLRFLLDNDPSGDPKGISKWRKVWSDFKNHTKQKYMRLSQCENPSENSLTNLEQRVLHLLGYTSSITEDNSESNSSLPKPTSSTPASNETTSATRPVLISRRILAKSGASGRSRLVMPSSQWRSAMLRGRRRFVPHRHNLELEERFREFERERWERENEREKERNALKERELALLERQIDTANQWQKLAHRVLDITENYIENHMT